MQSDAANAVAVTQIDMDTNSSLHVYTEYYIFEREIHPLEHGAGEGEKDTGDAEIDELVD